MDVGQSCNLHRFAQGEIEQRLEGEERVSPSDAVQKGIPGRGKGQWKTLR